MLVKSLNILSRIVYAASIIVVIASALLQMTMGYFVLSSPPVVWSIVFLLMFGVGLNLTVDWLEKRHKQNE